MSIDEPKSVSFKQISQMFANLSELSDKIAKEENSALRRELFKHLKKSGNLVHLFIEEIMEGRV